MSFLITMNSQSFINPCTAELSPRFFPLFEPGTSDAISDFK